MLPVRRRGNIYKPIQGGLNVKVPNHTSWRRTFLKGGYDRKGRPVAKKLDKPTSLTFIWNGWTKEEINIRIIDDAANILGIRPKRVIMLDQVTRKVCWDKDGSDTDVVEYIHTGGAK